MGSLEVGKIANVLVTEGDLFDEKMTIKHVFVEGRAVNLDVDWGARRTSLKEPVTRDQRG